MEEWKEGIKINVELLMRKGWKEKFEWIKEIKNI